MSTVFTVSCENWSDPLQQIPLTYTVKYRTPNPQPGSLPAEGSLRTITSASTMPRAEFFLPAGVIPVEMWITNAYQATTIWTDKAYVSDSYMEPCEFAKYLVEGYDSQLYAAMRRNISPQ